MNKRESIGLETRLSNLIVVVSEELLLTLEELVVLLVVDEPQLVGVLRERLDKAAELLLGVLGAHVQVLRVLEEDAQVGVVSESRVSGETREEHFVDLHRLLEYRQVLAFWIIDLHY